MAIFIKKRILIILLKRIKRHKLRNVNFSIIIGLNKYK